MLGKGSPKGSQWNKWDLHVHTPASIEQHYGDGQQQEVWDRYFSALETLPSEIKAIGINDYFMLDGYRRVIQAKEAGRLRNISLILPVVEFRLKIFAGNKKLQRINYHVIFSNELTLDEIEAHFLTKLSISFKLEDDKTHTVVGCDRASLINLGQAIINSTPVDKRTNESALKVGFANAVFSEEQIINLCSQTIFNKKIITALGITEWDGMRFDGGGTGIKRSLINGADIVFVASPNVSNYQNRRNQLISAEVNNRLIDCSDAHYLVNSIEPMRLGNTFTWLKADLTFEGLCRAIRCFDERVHVIDIGRKPDKLTTIQNNKGKFIERIEIRRKEGSTLQEKWFDCEVPFNADLVAIIGNQGSGKSALTDIIALCGNTRTAHFSFLSEHKFCDRQRKAAEFTATLYWADGTQTKRNLDEDVKDTEVERVRYVPQHFFDTITNETDVDQQSQFYAEIKKVIFSHIGKSDRMGYADLDELVTWRTQEIKHTLAALRKDLNRMNQKIFDIEEQVSLPSLERLANRILAKEQEIATHRLTRPQMVQEPEDAAEINSQIEKLRNQESDLRLTINTLKESLTVWKTHREIVTQKRQGAENEKHRIQSLVVDWQQEFDRNRIGLKAEEIISIRVNWSSFDRELERISAEINFTNQELDEQVPDSLAGKIKAITTQRGKLQEELEENNKVYQQYLTDEQAWNNHQVMLTGDEDIIDSLEWLKHQRNEATSTLPQQLATLYTNRKEKVKEIYTQLWKLAAIYQELTQDVRDYIAADELTRERYRLQFDIQLTEQGFTDRLFRTIKHSGSFYGVDEGKELVGKLLKEQDFNLADETVQFTENILSRLKNDYRQDPPVPDDISKILRINQSVPELYDYIFGLEYLNPQYTISLNNKPLKMLSPGERGVLLLVFYLLVDQGDEPLIIDQPEGNLNNQAIVKDLVPVFKEAKKRRQIIVVTHNPNLAVVSDAEQIIHAHIDFEDRNTVYFESGAIENPKFNHLMVNVLEGTPPAFKTRYDTYYLLSK
jgi:ABC-type lipoprotein export system ATPase subunit